MKLEIENKFNVGNKVSWTYIPHLFICTSEMKEFGTIVDYQANRDNNGFIYLIEQEDRSRVWKIEESLHKVSKVKQMIDIVIKEM